MNAGEAEALALLERWGLLLLHDQNFPSLSHIIAGAPIAGSWWGHAQGGRIFRAMLRLADHDDVALVKLVSKKVTFVHRRLWPQLLAIGTARAAWQVDGLSEAAAALLARLDRGEQVEAVGKPARELEQRLLAGSREVHGESGAHKLVFLSWAAFAAERGVPLSAVNAEAAQAELAALVERMNADSGAAATLPWTRAPVRNRAGAAAAGRGAG